ncbi:MAG: NADH-ubiquinone oxidoreductase-F iron-sulfur binding region domain-containing protein [bacterium]
MPNITTIEDLNQIHQKADQQLYPDKIKITVGTSSCGNASGADLVLKKIQEKIDHLHLEAIVESTGCIGYCQQEPIVSVQKPRQPQVFYGKVDVKIAEEIVTALKDGKVSKQYAIGKYDKDETLLNPHKHQFGETPIANEYEGIPALFEIPFYKKQKRLVTRNCGLINPERIEDYIARGGYFSLFKVLSQKTGADTIIAELKTVGLRGRSGEGFPTALKWDAAKKAEGPTKYIIGNGNEGDPSAFKDRMLLESDPHAVIEGLLIGAYTVGAKEAYLYINNTYSVAIDRVQTAIKQAEQFGFIGENICGSGFSCKLKLVRGAGAYMAGESTALLAAIEGQVPEPKAKYINVLEQGLYNKPTVINNPETLANVPLIIGKGGSWFSGIGKDKSKGTKLFTISGAIKNFGIIEVPFGITINEIITEIGEGASASDKIKGVHFGGPAGGILPLNNGSAKSAAKIPVDFELLVAAGSTIGAGSIYVIPENICILDLVKSNLDFLKDQACGKCTPCREGIRNLVRILTDISNGKGKPQDLDLLKEICAVMVDTSLCGVGTTASNPILSSLAYFNDEYLNHINNKKCNLKSGSGAKLPNLNAKLVS